MRIGTRRSSFETGLRRVALQNSFYRTPKSTAKTEGTAVLAASLRIKPSKRQGRFDVCREMMSSIQHQTRTTLDATTTTMIHLVVPWHTTCRVVRSRTHECFLLSLLLLLLLPNIAVHANYVYSSDSNCFIEPIGVGKECGFNTTIYFTARFGIPNQLNNINKNGNDTMTADTGGGQQQQQQQRVTDCRYAWQVLTNYYSRDTGNLMYTSFFYTMATGSELNASDPNCTVDCSAIVSSDSAFILTEDAFDFTVPVSYTIRHRLYILPILEGQEKEDLIMEWDPFPINASNDQPPKFGTLRISADGCTLEKWEPVPTSTPSILPSPTASPSASSVGSAMMVWPIGLIIAVAVVLAMVT